MVAPLKNPLSERPAFPAALVSLVLAALLAGACTDDPAAPPAKPDAAADAPFTVYTTFYPTWYFTSRIGGEHVKVVNPLPPDADPIFWLPPTKALQAFQQDADLIVLNGAGYAKWVASAMLPEDRIVNAGEAFEEDLVVIENAMTHSHGKGGEHTHQGIDGHTWMDPVNAMAQCRRIAEALIENLPDHEADFESNRDALIADLAALDARFKALATRHDGRTLLASHPAYNYIARRYGLKIHSFDFDPGSEPGPDHRIALNAFQEKEKTADWMLWESEPTDAVKAIFTKDFGLDAVVFSPCETPPAEGTDYVSVMKANLDRLESRIP